MVRNVDMPRTVVGVVTDPFLPHVGTEGGGGFRTEAGGLHGICGYNRRYVAVGSVQYTQDVKVVSKDVPVNGRTLIEPDSRRRED